MSTRYERRPARRAPISPHTIFVRINVAIILAILLFTAFVLPWLGGR